jgi:hypothetical protein
MTHTCTVCQSPDVIAISPGSEPETAPGGIVVQRGQPVTAWCASHWWARFGADLFSMPAREVSP